MDVWKSQLCCSYQYTHFVCMHAPLFLGPHNTTVCLDSTVYLIKRFGIMLLLKFITITLAKMKGTVDLKYCSSGYGQTTLQWIDDDDQGNSDANWSMQWNRETTTTRNNFLHSFFDIHKFFLHKIVCFRCFLSTPLFPQQHANQSCTSGAMKFKILAWWITAILRFDHAKYLQLYIMHCTLFIEKSYYWVEIKTHGSVSCSPRNLGRASDKGVFYRNEENAVFTHL